MKIKIFTLVTSFLMLSFLIACSRGAKKEIVIEEYSPVTRQLPLEPVYSRVAWSHLPKPIGPKFIGKSPYLEKIYVFEMSSSSLAESVSALSDAMGYEAKYPKHLAQRKVSLVMEGTVYQILDKICEQAAVQAEVDHEARIIRIVSEETKPKL